MAAFVISESTIGAERKLEEEGIPTHVSTSGLIIRICTIGMRLSHVVSHAKQVEDGVQMLVRQ